jgi:hypothetical protein
MLLYLTKWGSYQELLRVIKFVDNTKSFRLKVQPIFDDDIEWNLKIFVTVIGQETQKQGLVFLVL